MIVTIHISGTDNQKCTEYAFNVLGSNAVGGIGIGRATYDHVFKWLSVDPTLKKANFIAVFDIAGLHQLCQREAPTISNRHMFVVEQEE